jgi:hypothetical protein
VSSEEEGQWVSGQVTVTYDYLLLFSCYGGDAKKAFEFAHTEGLVTGSRYDYKQGCVPWKLKPKSHLLPDKTECSKECRKGSNLDYGQDKVKTGRFYDVVAEEEVIMKEIMYYGPVVAEVSWFR